MKRHSRWVAILVATLLAGCGGAPKATAPPEPEKPAEPVTARVAVQQMYTAARGWAADAQPLQVQAIPLGAVKSDGGKVGAWRAVFVSSARAKARTYTYAAAEVDGDLRKGVAAGVEERYVPQAQQRPFLMAALRKDSDEAYDVAVKQSTKYIQEHPDTPVTFLLALTPEFPSPAWRVVWGESVGRSDYSIYVDASTGEFLKKAR